MFGIGNVIALIYGLVQLWLSDGLLPYQEG
jgi:hypothetical protein